MDQILETSEHDFSFDTFINEDWQHHILEVKKPNQENCLDRKGNRLQLSSSKQLLVIAFSNDVHIIPLSNILCSFIGKSFPKINIEKVVYGIAISCDDRILTVLLGTNGQASEAQFYSLEKISNNTVGPTNLKLPMVHSIQFSNPIVKFAWSKETSLLYATLSDAINGDCVNVDAHKPGTLAFFKFNYPSQDTFTAAITDLPLEQPSTFSLDRVHDFDWTEDNSITMLVVEPTSLKAVITRINIFNQNERLLSTASKWTTIAFDPDDASLVIDLESISVCDTTLLCTGLKSLTYSNFIVGYAYDTFGAIALVDYSDSKHILQQQRTEFFLDPEIRTQFFTIFDPSSKLLAYGASSSSDIELLKYKGDGEGWEYLNNISLNIGTPTLQGICFSSGINQSQRGPILVKLLREKEQEYLEVSNLNQSHKQKTIGDDEDDSNVKQNEDINIEGRNLSASNAKISSIPTDKKLAKDLEETLDDQEYEKDSFISDEQSEDEQGSELDITNQARTVASSAPFSFQPTLSSSLTDSPNIKPSLTSKKYLPDKSNTFSVTDVQPGHVEPPDSWKNPTLSLQPIYSTSSPFVKSSFQSSIASSSLSSSPIYSETRRGTLTLTDTPIKHSIQSSQENATVFHYGSPLPNTKSDDQYSNKSIQSPSPFLVSPVELQFLHELHSLQVAIADLHKIGLDMRKNIFDGDGVQETDSSYKMVPKSSFIYKDTFDKSIIPSLNATVSRMESMLLNTHKQHLYVNKLFHNVQGAYLETRIRTREVDKLLKLLKNSHYSSFWKSRPLDSKLALYLEYLEHRHIQITSSINELLRYVSDYLNESVNSQLTTASLHLHAENHDEIVHQPMLSINCMPIRYQDNNISMSSNSSPPSISSNQYPFIQPKSDPITKGSPRFYRPFVSWNVDSPTRSTSATPDQPYSKGNLHNSLYPNRSAKTLRTSGQKDLSITLEIVKSIVKNNLTTIMHQSQQLEHLNDEFNKIQLTHNSPLNKVDSSSHQIDLPLDTSQDEISKEANSDLSDSQGELDHDDSTHSFDNVHHHEQALCSDQKSSILSHAELSSEKLKNVIHNQIWSQDEWAAFSTNQHLGIINPPPTPFKMSQLSLILTNSPREPTIVVDDHNHYRRNNKENFTMKHQGATLQDIEILRNSSHQTAINDSSVLFSPAMNAAKNLSTLDYLEDTIETEAKVIINDERGLHYSSSSNNESFVLSKGKSSLSGPTFVKSNHSPKPPSLSSPFFQKSLERCNTILPERETSTQSENRTTLLFSQQPSPISLFKKNIPDMGKVSYNQPIVQGQQSDQKAISLLTSMRVQSNHSFTSVPQSSLSPITTEEITSEISPILPKSITPTRKLAESDPDNSKKLLNVSESNVFPSSLSQTTPDSTLSLRNPELKTESSETTSLSTTESSHKTQDSSSSKPIKQGAFQFRPTTPPVDSTKVKGSPTSLIHSNGDSSENLSSDKLNFNPALSLTDYLQDTKTGSIPETPNVLNSSSRKFESPKIPTYLSLSSPSQSNLPPKNSNKPTLSDDTKLAPSSIQVQNPTPSKSHSESNTEQSIGDGKNCMASAVANIAKDKDESQIIMPTPTSTSTVPPSDTCESSSLALSFPNQAATATNESPSETVTKSPQQSQTSHFSSITKTFTGFSQPNDFATQLSFNQASQTVSNYTPVIPSSTTPTTPSTAMDDSVQMAQSFGSFDIKEGTKKSSPTASTFSNPATHNPFSLNQLSFSKSPQPEQPVGVFNSAPANIVTGFQDSFGATGFGKQSNFSTPTSSPTGFSFGQPSSFSSMKPAGFSNSPTPAVPMSNSSNSSANMTAAKNFSSSGFCSFANMNNSKPSEQKTSAFGFAAAKIDSKVNPTFAFSSAQQSMSNQNPHPFGIGTGFAQNPTNSTSQPSSFPFSGPSNNPAANFSMNSPSNFASTTTPSMQTMSSNHTASAFSNSFGFSNQSPPVTPNSTPTLFSGNSSSIWSSARR